MKNNILDKHNQLLVSIITIIVSMIIITGFSKTFPEIRWFIDSISYILILVFPIGISILTIIHKLK